MGQNVTFWYLLFSLRRMTWRSIKVVECINSLFPFYCRVAFCCKGSTICLSIHPMNAIWAVSRFWPLQIHLLYTLVYGFLSEPKFSFLYDKSAQDCDCMSHRKFTLDSFCRPKNCFLKCLCHFTLLWETIMHERLSFPRSLQELGTLSYFCCVSTILVSVWC
jgi:hypothetical protein